MSTPELIMRVAGMVLGVGLIVLGLIFAARDHEEGCMPFVAAFFGFVLLCAAFPGAEIFR